MRPGEPWRRKNGQESQRATKKHKASTEGMDRITQIIYFGCVEVDFLLCSMVNYSTIQPTIWEANPRDYRVMVKQLEGNMSRFRADILDGVQIHIETYQLPWGG